MNIDSEINYKMVVLARESRGFSQEELTEKLNISQGKLSKFENGIQGISDEILQRLSIVLNYPVSFFYQRDNIYNLSLYHYRKKLKAPKKDQDKVEAILNITRFNIERLLKSIEVPASNIPNFNIGLDGSSEDCAKYLREFWRIPKGRVDNLTKLAEDNGIIIISIDFESEDFDGLSIRTEENQPLIFINKTKPGDRQRFTLAHEIFHQVCHIGKPIPPERDPEDEAHRSASEFLMPEREIGPQLIKLNVEKLGELKLYWKVSMASIIYRAKSLNLLTEDQYKYLWMKMSPYRKVEPQPYSIPIEQSMLLREMVDAHLKDLGYSTADMGNLFSLNEKEFEEKYLSSKKVKFRIIR